MGNTKRASVVYIEHPKTGDVLCVWNKRFGGWCLPGGKVEEGETPDKAAGRELDEETGLVCESFASVYAAAGTVDPDVDVTVYEPASELRRDFRHHPTGGVGLESILDELHGEPGCPVAWMSRENMVYKGNPFASFYREFFRKHPPKKIVVFKVDPSYPDKYGHVAMLHDLPSVEGRGASEEEAQKNLMLKLGSRVRDLAHEVGSLTRSRPSALDKRVQKGIYDAAKAMVANRAEVTEAQWQELIDAVQHYDDAQDIPF